MFYLEKMEVEEPMDIDASADFDKFDDVLEEGEYVESNRVSRKNVPSPSTILVSSFESFIMVTA